MGIFEIIGRLHTAYLAPALVALLIYVLALRWAWRHRSGIALPVREIAGNWKQMTLVLLLTLVASAILHRFLPLSYDEACAFLAYVDAPMVRALFTYPSPNNHIFFSALTNVFWNLFDWTHSEMAVRFVALFCTALLLWVYFARFWRSARWGAAIVGALIFLNWTFLSYSFQARGYSMQCLFAVLAAASWYSRTGWTLRQRFALFLVSSFFGLYTSPSFLYAFAPLLLIVLWEIRDQWKVEWRFILAWGAVLAAAVMLVYAPVLLHFGHEVITANPYVSAKPQADLFRSSLRWFDSMRLVLGGHFAGALALLGFAASAIWWRKAYLLLFALVPWGMMQVLQQWPFDRVFLPVAVAMGFVWLHHFSKQQPQRPAFLVHRMAGLAAFVVVAGVVGWETSSTERGDIESAYHMKALVPAIEGRQVYFDEQVHWYMGSTVEGYARVHGQECQTVDLRSLENDILSASAIVFSDSTLLPAGAEIMADVPSLDGRLLVAWAKD